MYSIFKKAKPEHVKRDTEEGRNKDPKRTSRMKNALCRISS